MPNKHPQTSLITQNQNIVNNLNLVYTFFAAARHDWKPIHGNLCMLSTLFAIANMAPNSQRISL